MTGCGCHTSKDLACLTETRRAMVRASDFNGLDYVEVSDDQRELTVYFLGPAPEDLRPENFAICGGVREKDLAVVDLSLCPEVDPELDNCVVLTVDRPGDFSNYCLCLVNLPEDAPYDPRYRCLTFSFKANCPSEMDCKDDSICPETVPPQPELDYLAKDYASFRALILDRLAVTMPEWTERHIPDVGITLVELLAYTGDYLSYYQDAVATEAYLGTARRRVSVKRHARLVDYHLHEGCNARTWIAIGTSQDREIRAGSLFFTTGFEDAPDTSTAVPDWSSFDGIDETRYEVFAPLVPNPDAMLPLRAAHNEIHVYTWGDASCCLPTGATSVTLKDGSPPAPETGDPGANYQENSDCYGDDVEPDKPSQGRRALDLHPGNVLIFEERLGPETGNPADADPSRRHAVRLVSVNPSVDPLNGQPVLEACWAEEDALPAPFCISTLGPPPTCAMLENVSILRGNVVLADHGRWRPTENLGCAPMADDPTVCLAEGRTAEVTYRAGCFTHTPIPGPLTFSAPVDHGAPASDVLRQDPRQAVPALTVVTEHDPDCVPGKIDVGGHDQRPQNWTVVQDLLNSGARDAHVVADIDSCHRAVLRFGDDRLGRALDPFSRVHATRRTGNGPLGNVGSDKLTVPVHETLIDGLILTPRNPLPATGGTAPEPIKDAKIFAPHGFGQELARAITPADYAEIAARHPKVQRAAAEQRWNGSWYEIRVAIDPLGQAVADDALLSELFTELNRYRRIGHDLVVRPAVQVPLKICISVCAAPTHLREAVKRDLQEIFGAGCLPDGTLGFFHPDRLSFGEDIALSPLLTAAQAVDGVESVTMACLERLFEGPNGELAAGVLPIGPLEIARADSDPGAPENGRVVFDIRGGR